MSPPGTVIAENHISDNDVGIYLLSEGCCETRENIVIDNQLFGIVIQDGSNEVSENVITGGRLVSPS